MNPLLALRLSGRHVIRAAALGIILVLVSVPALTRAGQKLERVSHGPGFSRTIDCPPKRVSVAPAVACTVPVQLRAFGTRPAARLVPPVASVPPPSPVVCATRPLRAPPSALLS